MPPDDTSLILEPKEAACAYASFLNAGLTGDQASRFSIDQSDKTLMQRVANTRKAFTLGKVHHTFAPAEFPVLAQRTQRAGAGVLQPAPALRLRAHLPRGAHQHRPMACTWRARPALKRLTLAELLQFATVIPPPGRVPGPLVEEIVRVAMLAAGVLLVRRYRSARLSDLVFWAVCLSIGMYFVEETLRYGGIVLAGADQRYLLTGQSLLERSHAWHFPLTLLPGGFVRLTSGLAGTQGASGPEFGWLLTDPGRLRPATPGTVSCVLTRPMSRIYGTWFDLNRSYAVCRRAGQQGSSRVRRYRPGPGHLETTQPSGVASHHGGVR